MLSFICASNDLDMYRRCVERSLAIQTNRDFEVIRVDTEKNAYPSAAQALHDGAMRAKGEYLVFLHHDIVIEDSGFIDKLLACVEKQPFFIAGVAGAVPRGKWRKHIFSNIEHGEARENAGLAIDDAEAVISKSVDECLFVIPRDVYSRRPLTAYSPTWHLYAVEYCLWAEREKPGSVLTFPLRLWHCSKGASFNANYYEALEKIVDVYRRDFPVIYTTMGAWPTNRLLLKLRKLRRTGI